VESTNWDVIVVDEAARFPWIRAWLTQSNAPRIIVVQSHGPARGGPRL
jgi:hypothetical protein